MWFTASLLFKSVHIGQPDNDCLWEESIVLLRAETRAEAQQQAERLGQAEEHEYVSATGDLVKWTFQRVDSVYEILDGTLEHGTEVFSRFLRASEAESLLTPFKDKVSLNS
jgi:Domain of unknown function (DUF4288)